MIEGGGVVRRRIYPMADEFKQRRDIDGDFFFFLSECRKKRRQEGQAYSPMQV